MFFSHFFVVSAALFFAFLYKVMYTFHFEQRACKPKIIHSLAKWGKNETTELEKRLFLSSHIFIPPASSRLEKEKREVFDSFCCCFAFDFYHKTLFLFSMHIES